MMRSLFSAVSGLKTHQTRMDVIGNNIANVNTEAFKASSVRFSELMYQTMSTASGGDASTGTGGVNAKQVPDRRPMPGKRLDFYELAQITFEKPDMETFKGLKLAYEAAARGGNIPTALNAANEVAVARFLDRKIKYLDIPDIIEYAMNEVDYINNPTVEQILSTQKIVTDMIESRW